MSSIIMFLMSYLKRDKYFSNLNGSQDFLDGFQRFMSYIVFFFSSMPDYYLLHITSGRQKSKLCLEESVIGIILVQN